MRIFVSAVTNEFGKARDAVASDLRAHSHEVKDECIFTQGGDAESLLERLHDYIRDCNAVVCVIGKRSGSCPPPDKAQRFAKMLPPGIAEASYTQWEFFFARHYRRRLYTYIANDDYAPDESTPKGVDFPALQSAFVQYIMAENVYWGSFSNVDQLGRAVLLENWTEPSPPPPPPHRTRPIVLPYPSLGSLFKGRNDLLQKLQAQLRSPDGKTVAIAKPRVFYGLGGVGKTRAVVEYAWAHQDDYTALLFVVAETPETLRANLVALTDTLAPQLKQAPDDKRLAAVLDWLRWNPGWLLILDNADSKEAIAAVEQRLKELQGGQVLVTSRLSDFSGNFVPLSLDVLLLDDAVAFLLERTEGRRRKATDDEARARVIATEVDRLALALEQAAAYIAKRKLTFEGYLEQWHAADHSKMLDWFDETVTGYKRAVAITWQTSVAQLTEPGRRLLERLAFLAPEPVPEFLLDVPIPGAETENLREALDDLAAYSLVTRDAEGPFFLVHRLVQDITRRNLAGGRRQQSLTEALVWIAAAFPGDSGEVGSWPRAESLAPHARAVGAEADRTGIVTPTAHLMNRLGALYYSKGLYAEAEPLYRRSLAICEKAVGPDSSEIAIPLNDLAALCRMQGRYSEAESLYERSLAIQEKARGPDDPEIATSLNNLADLYEVQGRYAEAEPLLRRSLAIGERRLPADHPSVGIYSGNLARILENLRHPTEAEAMYKRALSIFESALGPDDVRVGTALNDLACFYHAQERQGEAEPLFARSISIREKTLGPDHPQVASSLNNFGEFLRGQGRHAEAEPLYHRSLAIREKVFGPDHDDVANSLNSLGLLCASQGRNNEASAYLRRCVSILLSISHQNGRNHPYLESAIAYYADALGELGKSKSEIEAEIGKLQRGKQ